MTHDHVFQGALGQPAVEKHWDEDIPYRRPEDLKNTMDPILSHVTSLCLQVNK